jgi:ABC-2 type transport system ATP-binding protein
VIALSDLRRLVVGPTPPYIDGLLLQVTDLTKRYGHLTALSGVSFSILPGEVLGLIGPNGSGKTTLFECLAGVLPMDSGAVLLDGRPIASGGRSSILFYLPDAIAPWPAQSVRWALDFTMGYFGVRPRSASSRGLTPSVSRATRDDVIARLDLAPLLDASIGTLSKGQRKRALLAIGLLTPQAVLLADEPFEGLDLRQSRDVARALREYAKDGRTLFLSIHQIGEAARVCDRFVLLSGGRVCGEGTLDHLSSLTSSRSVTPATPDLEEVFLALT